MIFAATFAAFAAAFAVSFAACAAFLAALAKAFAVFCAAFAACLDVLIAALDVCCAERAVLFVDLNVVFCKDLTVSFEEFKDLCLISFETGSTDFTRIDLVLSGIEFSDEAFVFLTASFARSRLNRSALCCAVLE